MDLVLLVLRRWVVVLWVLRRWVVVRVVGGPVLLRGVEAGLLLMGRVRVVVGPATLLVLLLSLAWLLVLVRLRVLLLMLLLIDWAMDDPMRRLGRGMLLGSGMAKPVAVAPLWVVLVVGRYLSCTRVRRLTPPSLMLLLVGLLRMPLLRVLSLLPVLLLRSLHRLLHLLMRHPACLPSPAVSTFRPLPLGRWVALDRHSASSNGFKVPFVGCLISRSSMPARSMHMLPGALTSFLPLVVVLLLPLPLHLLLVQHLSSGTHWVLHPRLLCRPLRRSLRRPNALHPARSPRPPGQQWTPLRRLSPSRPFGGRPQ